MSNLPLSQPFSCLGQTKGPWWIWFDDLLHNVTRTKCCQKSNTVWNLIHDSYIKLLKQYVKHLFRNIHMKYLQYILDINWTVSYLNERSIKPYFNDFFNVCVSSRLQFSRNTSVFRKMIDVLSSQVHKCTKVVPFSCCAGRRLADIGMASVMYILYHIILQSAVYSRIQRCFVLFLPDCIQHSSSYSQKRT